MRLTRKLSILAAEFLPIAFLSAQTPEVPDWQTAAGGKLSFDVASVKPSKTFRSPAFPLDKPGKLGPKLLPHSEGLPCGGYPVIDPHAFPSQCDAMILTFPRDGMARAGSRNTTPSLLARDIASMGSLAGEVDKPVVERTGLKDTFDYVLEWNGRLPGQPPPPGGAAPPDNIGTGFLQAVREQLGLKLVPGRAAVRTIVIDHVEAPSEN